MCVYRSAFLYEYVHLCMCVYRSDALKLSDVMCVVPHIIANNYTTLFELVQYSFLHEAL